LKELALSDWNIRLYFNFCPCVLGKFAQRLL